MSTQSLEHTSICFFIQTFAGVTRSFFHLNRHVCISVLTVHRSTRPVNKQPSHLVDQSLRGLLSLPHDKLQPRLFCLHLCLLLLLLVSLLSGPFRSGRLPGHRLPVPGFLFPPVLGDLPTRASTAPASGIQLSAVHRREFISRTT